MQFSARQKCAEVTLTRLGLETGALTSIARDTLATTRAIESTAVNTFGLSDEPPVFARGEGALLFDERGARWIDLVCGSSVTNLGHGNARIADAIRSMLDTGILHTGTRLPSPPRAALYEALVELAPDGLDVVHLANSGSEAIEIALKAAQHATGRSEVVAFFGAYHGRTRGALSVTASARARAAFRPFDTAVHFMPYPYGLRPPIPGHSQHTIGDACLAYLDDALSNPFSGIAPSALIVEAVQGVAGVVIPPLGFLKGLRRICDQHGIVMILDEIWNGFGRSGLWFAFERDEVTPDLVVFGKALSGSLPLSGVVAALAGPMLGRFGGPLLEPQYVGSFLLLALVSMIAAGALLGLNIPTAKAEFGDALRGRAWSTLVGQPAYLVALFGAATGYGVMILAMTATPLAMVHHHHDLTTAATVIQLHVLGMFLPSFVTGSLIAHFGVLRIMLTGVALLAGHVLQVAGPGEAQARLFARFAELGIGAPTAHPPLATVEVIASCGRQPLLVDFEAPIEAGWQLA